MSAFLIVIIIVAAVAVAGALLRALGVLAGPARVRRGTNWIDHPDDVPVEERPSEDAVDEPVGDLRPRARH
jgi:hypothetical protein